MNKQKMKIKKYKRRESPCVILRAKHLKGNMEIGKFK